MTDFIAILGLSTLVCYVLLDKWRVHDKLNHINNSSRYASRFLHNLFTCNLCINSHVSGVVGMVYMLITAPIEQVLTGLLMGYAAIGLKMFITNV